jgi:hypothetical protein
MTDRDRPDTPPSRSEPWWARPGEPSRDAGETPPEPMPGPTDFLAQYGWFERREPILQAVAARLEPLERLTERISAEVEGTRDHLAAFVTETRDALKVLLEAVETVRTESVHASTSPRDPT